ncbi:unnamed protein product, partial [Rotaria sp. Silwood1]
MGTDKHIVDFKEKQPYPGKLSLI